MSAVFRKHRQAAILNETESKGSLSPRERDRVRGSKILALPFA